MIGIGEVGVLLQREFSLEKFQTLLGVGDLLLQRGQFGGVLGLLVGIRGICGGGGWPCRGWSGWPCRGWSGASLWCAGRTRSRLCCWRFGRTRFGRLGGSGRGRV